MMAEHVHINSALTVQKKIKELTNEEIKISRVQKVMRKDMDMTYTKMKSIALHSNSTNNLILRQRFAIKLL